MVEDESSLIDENDHADNKNFNKRFQQCENQYGGSRGTQDNCSFTYLHGQFNSRNSHRKDSCSQEGSRHNENLNRSASSSRNRQYNDSRSSIWKQEKCKDMRDEVSCSDPRKSLQNQTENSDDGIADQNDFFQVSVVKIFLFKFINIFLCRWFNYILLHCFEHIY